jgi:hypothetical protein
MLFCYLVAEIIQLRLWVYPRRWDQTRLWFAAPSRTREFLTNKPFYFRSPLAYEAQSRCGEGFFVCHPPTLQSAEFTKDSS